MSTQVSGLRVGLYLHFKGGYYFVASVDDHDSTNGEKGGRKLVRYYSLAHEHWCVRDRVEFCHIVEWPDGVQRPRFMPVNWTTLAAQMGEFRGYVDSRGEQPNFLVDGRKYGP